MSASTLRLWRLVWLLAVGLACGIAIATWPVFIGRLGEVCAGCPVTPAVVLTLQTAGLTVGQWAAWTLAIQGGVMLGWVGMGLLVFLSRPRDPRALLMAALLALTGPGFGGFLHEAVADLPMWYLPDRLFPFIGFVCFLALPLVIPDGRIAPRWSLAVAAPLCALLFVNFLFPASRLAFSNWPPLLSAPLLFPLMLVIVVIIPIYRYRRIFTPQERQQTRWVLFGLALAFAMIVTTLVAVNAPCTPPLRPERYLYCEVGPGIGFGLGPLMIPLFIGIAILRSRLWDIDVIIRRTLIYSILSALLALAFFGSVVVLQNLLKTLTGQGQHPLVTVISTLAIAALSVPLRNRVQAFIDRRFYRRKYDAARTLAAFALSARDDVDLDDLTARLVGVVDETLQPASVGLWLAPGEGRAGSAER